jgi:shikimate kinase
MTPGSSIFLIGPMGSGKSAVGKRLAARLNRPFHDSDSEIERRTGVDVAYVFEREGEAGFRKRESDVIDDLTKLDDIILATGGGAVLDPRNRRNLAERGYVIYLEASVEQQYGRTRGSKVRPLLGAGDDRRAKLEELMRIRDPLYREIADHSVPTDGRRVDAVASEIERHWRRRMARGDA